MIESRGTERLRRLSPRDVCGLSVVGAPSVIPVAWFTYLLSSVQVSLYCVVLLLVVSKTDLSVLALRVVTASVLVVVSGSLRSHV